MCVLLKEGKSGCVLGHFVVHFNFGCIVYRFVMKQAMVVALCVMSLHVTGMQFGLLQTSQKYSNAADHLNGAKEVSKVVNK